MSVSIQDLCSDWMADNDGFKASWEYDVSDDSYNVRVCNANTVNPIASIGSKANIPADSSIIGSAVVGLVLDVLKAQVMLFEEYNIVL